LGSAGAQAANPLGFYVGAGGGYADLRYDPSQYVPCFGVQDCFGHSDVGWTAFVGLQPLTYVGAELQYLDFGQTSNSPPTFLGTNSLSAKALALFATGVLPLPVGDLYAKAGVGRVQTKVSTSYPDLNTCADSGICGYPPTDETAARFGWGLGVKFKLSALAIRVEYVRFSVPEGDPDLLSLALLWRF
jgi:opacity protein-like surface antigen